MYCTCHACYASCMLVHVFSGACDVCMCIWYMWCMYICTWHVYLVVYVCVCGWCMIVYVFDGACRVCMCISYMYGTCIYWTCVFSCVCMCILWMYGACCACIHVYVVHICNCKCKKTHFTNCYKHRVTIPCKWSFEKHMKSMHFLWKAPALFMKSTCTFCEKHLHFCEKCAFHEKHLYFSWKAPKMCFSYEKQQKSWIQHISLILTWSFIECRGNAN